MTQCPKCGTLVSTSNTPLDKNMVSPLYTPVRGPVVPAGSESVAPILTPLQGSDLRKKRVSNGEACPVRADKRYEGVKHPFVAFWEAYPLRLAREPAWQAWRKLNPPIDRCLEALAWQKKSKEWTKDDGAWIPFPASWLNAHRWEDEKPAGPKRLLSDRVFRNGVQTDE